MVQRFLLIFLSSLQLLLTQACSKNPAEQNQAVTPELRVLLEVAESANKPILSKLQFQVAEGWHIYGPDAQKNGRPTRIEVKTPQNLVPVIEWPATQQFDEGASGISLGYSNHFEVPIELKDDSVRGKDLRVFVTWVACKSVCVPGEAELSHSIP